MCPVAKGLGRPASAAWATREVSLGSLRWGTQDNKQLKEKNLSECRFKSQDLVFCSTCSFSFEDFPAY